jgi:hypothetical protein
MGKEFIASHFCFARNITVSKSLVKISTKYVHSCHDKTRLAVFSVPFPHTKFPNVFVPAKRFGVFFLFVVFRFCTIKQSFGYFYQRLVMQVFVPVFIYD